MAVLSSFSSSRLNVLFSSSSYKPLSSPSSLYPSRKEGCLNMVWEVSTVSRLQLWSHEKLISSPSLFTNVGLPWNFVQLLVVHCPSDVPSDILSETLLKLKWCGMLSWCFPTLWLLWHKESREIIFRHRAIPCRLSA